MSCGRIESLHLWRPLLGQSGSAEWIYSVHRSTGGTRGTCRVPQFEVFPEKKVQFDLNEFEYNNF